MVVDHSGPNYSPGKNAKILLYEDDRVLILFFIIFFFKLYDGKLPIAKTYFVIRRRSIIYDDELHKVDNAVKN